MKTTTGMGLRLELFVRDMDASIAFYRDVLGFELLRREPGYASIRSGGVTFGLGPIAKLPVDDGYFTQARLAGDRGAGVEIVLEVDDVTAYRERVRAAGYDDLQEDIQRRPWGLADFRIADPDGYYLRITSRA
jgi:catechol 2,3-dioxygenase-like lactoylglutathione lyase family enzyme